MDHSGKRSTKRWYRKAQVAERYGVDVRTVERAVKDGRLPPPKYLLGQKFRYWDGDELDAHDDNLATRMPQRAGDQPNEVVDVTAPPAPKRPRGRPRKADATAVATQAAT